MKKDYEYDVQYEVWRAGGNPDEIDANRVDDCYDDGLCSEEAAQIEINAQFKRRGERV